eukprot:sb/3476585/
MHLRVLPSRTRYFSFPLLWSSIRSSRTLCAIFVFLVSFCFVCAIFDSNLMNRSLCIIWLIVERRMAPDSWISVSYPSSSSLLDLYLAYSLLQSVPPPSTLLRSPTGKFSVNTLSP